MYKFWDLVFVVNQNLMYRISNLFSLLAVDAQSVGVVEYNKCPGYDTKQSDGKVPVMPDLWGMRSTPLLPLLPGLLRPGVVAPDKGPIYGLNRTNGILMLN